MIDPVDYAPSASGAYAVGSSVDSGRAESVRDDVAVEQKAGAEAALQAFQGTMLDTEA